MFLKVWFCDVSLVFILINRWGVQEGVVHCHSDALAHFFERYC